MSGLGLLKAVTGLDLSSFIKPVLVVAVAALAVVPWGCERMARTKAEAALQMTEESLKDVRAQRDKATEIVAGWQKVLDKQNAAATRMETASRTFLKTRERLLAEVAAWPDMAAEQQPVADAVASSTSCEDAVQKAAAAAVGQVQGRGGGP